jgi:hypothetical protein
VSKNKYNAIRTEVDNIKFHSKKEAEYYKKLKLLESIGEISDLELQPKFVICPAFIRCDNKKIRSRVYTADFKYKNKNGEIIICDVKGIISSEAKLRITLAEYLHSIKVEIIKDISVVF